MYLRLLGLRLEEEVSLEGAQDEEAAQGTEDQGEATQGDMNNHLSLLSTPLRLLRNLSTGLRLKQHLSPRNLSLKQLILKNLSPH